MSKKTTTKIGSKFESKKETKRIKLLVDELDQHFINDGWSLDDYVNFITQGENIPMNLTKLITHSSSAFEKYLKCETKTKQDKDIWEDDLFKMICVRKTIERFKENGYDHVYVEIPRKTLFEFNFDLGYIRGICGYAIANKRNIMKVKLALTKLFSNVDIDVDNKVYWYLTRTLNNLIKKETERRKYLNSLIIDDDKKFEIEFDAL